MTAKNKWVPYLLLLPAFLLVIFVIAYPIVNAIGMSFQEMVLFKPKDIHFIGFDNYVNVLKDEIFYEALKNTVLWVGFGVFFQFLFGFILALILNKQFRGRGAARALSLIPWVTPGVLIGLMWRWMYDGNYGVINDLLMKVNLIKDNIPWLASSDLALPAVIVTIVWQGIPFFAIMLLAGLQTIPGELYEAATVDGANKVQQLFYVTIPSMKSTILVTTLLRVIWVANSIDVIYSMTAGGPGYNSLTLSVYTFIKAQKSLDFGYASTLAVYLTLLLSAFAIIYMKMNSKGKEA